MDNFKTVYRILNFLKKSELLDKFDSKSFTPGCFGLKPGNYWVSTLERMIDDGHIKGVSIQFGIDDYALVNPIRPRITTKGLEYLEESPLIRKAARFIEGTHEMLP